MLEPNTRKALLEALRPPDGYTLDFALGTTFSLDLQALLMVPLAFTFFDIANTDEGPATDPVALLEAVRRNSGKIAVFAQAAQIKIPEKRNQTLYAELEKCIFAVQPPDRSAIFHPKLWVLRFMRGREVSYRLLCSSRNLTFDRSWDTLLVTEGKLTDRQRAFSRYTSLGHLIKELPRLSIRALPETIRNQIRRMQEEVRLTDFEIPEGFEEMEFYALGPEGHLGFPRELPRRVLVVSPFVDDRFLKAFTESSNESILVSRDEELRRLNRRTIEIFSKVYCLNPEAQGPEGDEPGSEEENRLDGLHSKIFIAEYGWDAWVISGSANATEAAFNRNYEFLVGLKGKASKVGINAFLNFENNVVGFRSLLSEFRPHENPQEFDRAQEWLDREADRLCRLVATWELQAEVTPAAEPDSYDIRLRLAEIDRPFKELPHRLMVWPITLSQQYGSPIEARPQFEVLFSKISFEALTSFFAFELVLEKNGKTAARRFVVNVPVVGFPANRSERLLRCFIKNSEDLLRLILLILSENRGLEERLSAPNGFGGEDWKANGFEGAGLLESLMRSLASQPWRLDHIQRVVTDLRKSADGNLVLPPGFAEVWDPIWRVRETLRDD